MNIKNTHHFRVVKDFVDRLADTIEYLDNENIKLNKALDKACKKLAFVSNEHIIDELGSFTLGEINRTKDEWKEWLMLDD